MRGPALSELAVKTRGVRRGEPVTRTRGHARHAGGRRARALRGPGSRGGGQDPGPDGPAKRGACDPKPKTVNPEP